jgi:class 3 adenylate cyclase
MAVTTGKLTSERVRGLVWVCDIQDSTKYLNNDEKVDLFEDYIARFYYISSQIANAANATMYKWTGDGFIAWFDCDLDRNAGKLAASLCEAAWQLSFLNNVTQLGLSFKSPIKLRNGITYEKDGLHIMIENPVGEQTSDYVGRDVVLAFRISGISVDFPSIITTWEIVNRVKDYPLDYLRFEKLEISEEQIDRYFKGEKRLAKSLFGTSAKIKESRYRSTENVIKELVNTKTKIQNIAPSEFASKYHSIFTNGPGWAKVVGDKLIEFIKHELYGNFEELFKTTYINKKIT